MKKGVIVVIILLILIALGAVFYFIYPAFNVIERNDPLHDTSINWRDNTIYVSGGESSENYPGLLYTGELVADDHEVSGKVVVLDNNGKRMLRFEDFDTVNGPDLRIYLSEDTNAENFIDLGAIKGTRGNINYEIPDNVDLEKYDKVLVWCRAFKVLFSHADLESA